MNIMLVIFSSIISGLLGVFVSNYYQKQYERKRDKVKLIEDLLGNRNDLTSLEFSLALNKIFIVFFDSQSVMNSLKNFHECTLSSNQSEQLANEKLLQLFKALTDDVGIRTKFTDNFYLQPFNVARQNHIKG